MASIVGSILGIVVCGGIGAVGGWLLATGIGLAGVPAALAAALAGVVIAAALWVAGTALLRARGLIR
jgi:hypothetical protein